MEAARDARGEQGADVGTPVTIIVPTFNERDSVAELIARTAAALAGFLIGHLISSNKANVVYLRDDR